MSGEKVIDANSKTYLGLSINSGMAASTLCILSVVSRHIMYIIKYCSNIKIYFPAMSNKLLPYHTPQTVCSYHQTINRKSNDVIVDYSIFYSLSRCKLHTNFCLSLYGKFLHSMIFSDNDTNTQDYIFSLNKSLIYRVNL